MTELTPQQEQDAREALSDLRRVVAWLEAGETTLAEVARVLADNRQYIDPVYRLLQPR